MNNIWVHCSWENWSTTTAKTKKKKKKSRKRARAENVDVDVYLNGYQVCVWIRMKNENYFTI